MELESSKTLETRLLSCDCTPELKNAISSYINSMQKEIQGAGNSVGIAYRGNLHYILDNIGRPELALEIQSVTH